MADIGTYNTDWAAVAQAGASLLGSTAQMIYQGEADKYNRKLFRETRDLQRQWALEDYEKVLRDSSPEQQVKRLREAGLNPNLVYGSGNIQTGVTSAPHVDMPQLPYKQRGLDLDLSAINAFGSILDARLKQAEVKKIEADTKKVDSETKGQDLQNQFDEETKLLREFIVDNEYRMGNKMLLKVDQDMTNQSFLTSSQISVNQQQVETLIQARVLQWKQYELTAYQIGESIKQAWKNVEIAATNAQANLMSAGAAVTNSMANYTTALATQGRYEKLNELTSLEAGQAAIEFMKLYENKSKYISTFGNELWNKAYFQRDLENFKEKFGISFPMLQSLIPLATPIFK